jgi:hypothetical protein
VRQVAAHHLGLLQVGARRVQELDGLGAALRLALAMAASKLGEDLRRQQVAQRRRSWPAKALTIIS